MWPNFKRKSILSPVFLYFVLNFFPDTIYTYIILYQYNYISFYTQKHHCYLQLPSALILHKQAVPQDFSSGIIRIDGQLEFRQKSTFYCPFFMRHIKSHFHHQLIPENSSTIDDYNLLGVQKILANNPGYLQFGKTVQQSSHGHIDNGILVTVRVDVNEIGARYHTTFWQKALQIWIQYLSVLCAFVVAVGQIKEYMFGRQIIRAWEVVPWKKLY